MTEEEKKTPGQRLVLVAPLQHPVEFRVMPDEPEAFPDKIIMGAYVGGRIIARRAMEKPPALVEKEMRLRGKTILRDVRPMIYSGLEETPRGTIQAVLSIPQEPMDFDSLPDSGMDFSELGALTPLGLNIRPAEERKHPDDMMKECCDHLDHILEGTFVPQTKRITRQLMREPIVPVTPLLCVHNRPWRTCSICRS